MNEGHVLVFPVLKPPVDALSSVNGYPLGGHSNHKICANFDYVFWIAFPG